MTDFGDGLNLVAVFAWDELPPALQSSLRDQANGIAYRQVILIGHAGRDLWQAVAGQAAAAAGNPIDDYATAAVDRYFAKQLPTTPYAILYPAKHTAAPLLSLGELAGWHYPSPFLLGVNQRWGSWFAYRALVVADSKLALTEPLAGESPCIGCPAPCIDACPPGATTRETFHWQACTDHRMATNSSCAETCLARLACPVATDHRYTDNQIAYHYRRSLTTICELRKTEQ